MTVRRAAAALFALLTVVPVAACSGSDGSDSTPAASTSAQGTSAPAFPVDVTAANGTVTITRRPTAVVSLSPTATESLFAVGAGAQVKAVDRTSTYPATAPKTSLDAYKLNVEAVAKYRPDLVVASNLTAAQLGQFRTLRIPVLLEPAAKDLPDAYAQIAALGRATGHAAAGAATVARMKQRIAALAAAAPKTTATYYYELDQTYYSVTSATFIGRALQQLHLRSVADAAKGAAAAGGYPQLSAEFVVKSDPGLVLLADTRCCGQSPATVAKRPGWSTMSAVRDGRVVGLDDDIASRWGPRIVDLLTQVAGVLRQHPVS